MEQHSQPRLALIGCGGIAGGGGAEKAGHLLALEKMGLHVRTYCDVNLDLARRRREQFGPADAKVTAQADEVLADPDIDAVIICTRHDSNAPLAVRAVKAGKDVFVEKALALSVEACQAVVDAKADRQEDHGRVLEAVYAGVQGAMPLKGKARLLVAQCSEPTWESYDFWGKDPLAGGGQAFMCGIHTADMMLELAGSEPVRVVAMGELSDETRAGSAPSKGEEREAKGAGHGEDVEREAWRVERNGKKIQTSPDSSPLRPTPHAPRPTVINKAYALVEFANGCHGIFASSDTGECGLLSKFSLEFHTGSGVAVAHERLKYLTVTNIPGLENLREEDEHFDHVMLDFVRCIRDDLPAPVGPTEGLRATRLIVRIVESIRSGGAPVGW